MATVLTPHLGKMTDFLDAWRANRRNIYRPFYDRVVGRLLIAMGEPELARRRLDEALELAEETGMHCYDAELLRLRAHTHADPVTRRADLAAALALAQRQGAPLFELRAALDDFDLTGDQARAALTTAVSRLPVDCAFPEYRRAVAITSPLAQT